MKVRTFHRPEIIVFSFIPDLWPNNQADTTKGMWLEWVQDATDESAEDAADSS